MHFRLSSKRSRANAWGPARTRSPSRVARRDSGMVTAETAVVLPVMVVLFSLLLAGVGQAVDYVRVIDAARSAARLAARGETVTLVEEQALREAPDGSHVEIRLVGEQVQVAVTAPGRRLLGPIELPSAATVAVALVENSARP